MTDASAGGRIGDAPESGWRGDGQAWLVGGGIASLAAAVSLIRHAQVPGPRIHVLEQRAPGGSLDAGGNAAEGFSMRGTRMFGPAYVLSYELLDAIPSLDDPEKSVTQDIFEFWQAEPWRTRARLVGQGRITDLSTWGLDNADRVALIRFMLAAEDTLAARPIDSCFRANFFGSHFWLMWSSMFGFETWHDAAELQRYLLRFLRLFPDLSRLEQIQSTRYNGFDSIVRPMLAWLRAQGVHFDTGAQVTDLDFAPAPGGRQAVVGLHVQREGQAAVMKVAGHDIVIATLGSMTECSSLGSMDAPPPEPQGLPGGAWALWQRLADQSAAFGRPAAFCGQVERTRWITFTVTQVDDRFFQRLERFSGSPAGRGGLVTLTSSNWMITFHLYHPPAYASQPGAAFVWWGYGLHADREGNHVKKTLRECSGREILEEVLWHLGMHDERAALLDGARCIPCLLPYATSQFMPRRPGDRPPVLPPSTINLAFVGQYCEIPDDVVFTVEYSVHSALLAVAGLTGCKMPLPATYHGPDHPNALVGAMKTILQ